MEENNPKLERKAQEQRQDRAAGSVCAIPCAHIMAAEVARLWPEALLMS